MGQGSGLDSQIETPTTGLGPRGLGQPPRHPRFHPDGLHLGCTDITSSVRQLEGTGLVLHDFDGADDAELSVYMEQKVFLDPFGSVAGHAPDVLARDALKFVAVDSGN